MISSQLLCELNGIIEKINNGSMSFEELNQVVEDTDFFVKVLKSVNKNSLKNIVTVKKSHSKTPQKSDDGISYTSDEVHKIISSFTSEEIQDKFTTKQLKEMFIAVYGIKPRSAQKKHEIIKDIIDWFSTAERTKALSKLQGHV